MQSQTQCRDCHDDVSVTCEYVCVCVSMCVCVHAIACLYPGVCHKSTVREKGPGEFPRN